MRRHQTTDQDQVWGFQWATVSRILEALERQLAADSGNRLQIMRNRALLLTGYDLLARREEFTGLTWGRMEFADDGSGLATIARAKGDPEGRGTHHYLAHDTVAALRAWRDVASPTERPDRREALFRGLSARGRGGPPDAAERRQHYRDLPPARSAHRAA